MIYVLGGGTINPIATHMSLCSPAFGSVAKEISDKLSSSGHSITTLLTKMADNSSEVITNKDLDVLVDKLLANPKTKAIIMSCAVCDYEVKGGDKYGSRMKTSEGNIDVTLTPSDKIIHKIRRTRPDIFLVGFKATTGYTEAEQHLEGLRMLKNSKCNLVLANDLHTRNNIIITPEESYYTTEDRDDALNKLCDMIDKRLDLTYHRTNYRRGVNQPIQSMPNTFVEVMQYIVTNGGFPINNGNGFPNGHFCYKPKGKDYFFSSIRKHDHNKVFDRGMCVVHYKEDGFKVVGTGKASVGATSQYKMFEEYPEYDCIVHTHNPIKEGSVLNTVPQYPYQCGSLECGMNTVNGLKEYDGILAVYLDKHGANFMFKSTDDSAKIIRFIEDNVVLGKKTV